MPSPSTASRRRLWLPTLFVIMLSAAAFVAWRATKSTSDADSSEQTAQQKLTAKPILGPRPQAVAPQARTQSGQRVDPMGTLRLEGQVIDSDSAPVTGAIVTLNSAPRRTAITESDGSFYFERLLPRAYTLIATADEGFAGPVGARLSTSSEPIVLRILPGAKVEVEVVSATTKGPIEGATAKLRGWIDKVGAPTDKDGVTRITGVPYGYYRLGAAAPGYASAQTWFFASEVAAVQRARLELRKGAPVSGRVIGPDGAPVADARVIYESSSYNQTYGVEKILTDDDGHFRVPALAAGSYVLTAHHGEFVMARSSPIIVDGITGITDVVLQLGQSAVLSGTVVDSADVPVSSALVRASYGRQAYANAQGEFELRGLPREKVRVIALSDSASSQPESVDLEQVSEVRDVKLVLDVTGIIAGIVVNTEDEPVEGAEVMAYPEKDSEDWWGLRYVQRELTDAGGRFQMHGLPTGRYELRVNPPGLGRRGFEWRRKPTLAEVGDTDVRITLEPDGGVKGKVAFPDGTVPKMFKVDFGGRVQARPFATKDGSFEIDRLPPREYTLSFSGPELEAKSLPRMEIEAGRTTDLGTVTVQRGMVLSGRVTDSQQRPIAGATVFGGHVLVGDGIRADSGNVGPKFGFATQSTTTDGRGEFALRGIGRGDITVVATHDSMGRSEPLALTRVVAPVTGINLVIQAYGTVEGVVTSGGKPMPHQMLNAQSRSAPLAMAVTRGRDDGSFRFDRLAAGSYAIGPVVFAGGLTLHSTVVQVRPGETTRVEIALESGPISASITPVTDAGPVHSAVVVLIPGTVSGVTGTDMMLAGKDSGANEWSFVVTNDGSPGTISKLKPGQYTVCGTGLPEGVAGFDQGLAYMVRYGSFVQPSCSPLELAPQPEEQKFELPVEIAPASPIPEDDGGDEESSAPPNDAPEM